MELKKDKKTIFLSSHILTEVEELCDKISIIRQGEIIETGTLKQLRHLLQTNIKVETKKEIKGLKDMKGVHNYKIDDGEISIQVDNDALSEVIAFIGEHEVVSLVCAPPSLEELFMTHYKNEGDD